MGIDIRLPIGLMFTLLGLFLTTYGIITMSDIEIYKRSLGININLISGIAMLVFGLIMLLFSLKKKNKT
jgi:hypothetical protein